MSVNAISAQGSKVYMGTGTGAAKTVTAISKAFRAEVTSAAHGLTKGDRVTFASVTGMTEINGLTGIVIDYTTNTFVVDIDSRAFTTYVSGGTATPVTYTQIKEIKNFKPSGSTVGEVDVTDLDSTAKEFRPGLADNGSFSMDMHHLSNDPGQAAARTAFNASAVKDFKITDPVGAVYTFQGYFSNFPNLPDAAVDGVLVGAITVRISGSISVA
ncbi:MAG: ubiquitin-activating E1 FCCH domain-containing protein [Thermodesulfobacteriota bacterium]